METKPLLFGLIGFFIGGLLVSVAATTLDRPTKNDSDMSMSQMTGVLKGKYGDDFDKAFIEMMVSHHEGAVDMAKLIPSRAKHNEIKQLGEDIISAQTSEIADMKQWQKDWGYRTDNNSKDAHGAH